KWWAAGFFFQRCLTECQQNFAYSANLAVRRQSLRDTGAIVQNAAMDLFTINPAKVRDISAQLLDSRGRVQVTSASLLAKTTAQERLVFGVRQGLYSFPTDELCDFLRSRIAGRSAIEIGA